jgi:hypothetical protein
MTSLEGRLTALENRPPQVAGNPPIPPVDIIQQRIPKKARREPNDDDDSEEKSILSMDLSLNKSDSNPEVRAVLGLLFAIVDQDDPSKVTLATLQPGIETLFTKKNFISHWDRNHGHAKQKHTNDNAHFLASCLSDEFQVLPSLLRRLVSGQIYPYPMANLRSKETYGSDVFLMHFASPTTSSELADHQQHSRQTREECDNDLFDQPAYHRAKKSTSLHIFLSFCDNIENILASIANFMIVAGTLVVVPEWGISSANPSIINYFHELANLFTKADARNRIASLAKQPQLQHLLFSVFCCFQDILGSFGNIIRKSDLVSQLISGSPTDDMDFSIFANTVSEFNRAKDILDLLVTRSNTSSFVSAPMSFNVLFPSKKNDEANKGKEKEEGNRPKKHNDKDRKPYSKGDPKGDWLLHVDRTKKLTTFKFQDSGIDPFCLCFAVKDYTCRYGINCKNHHLDYSTLADNKKEALKAYLATNNAFKLAE